MAQRPKISEEAQNQADLVTLLGYAEFGRFLLRLGIASGIWSSASGSDDRRLHLIEGRRSLGFDVLGWIDDAMSISHRSGLPIAAMALVLNQNANLTPGETHDPSEADDDSDIQR